MFIGEMGCWLVVLLSHVYQRYLSPRLSGNQSPLLAGGYRPVNTADGDEDEEDQTIDGPNDAEDPSKPLRLADGRIPLRGVRTFLLAAPACCDIAGTTLMNVGLLFVAASIYQMTRGALVLFVGLFSVIFLHRKLYLYQWFALFVVVLGVALVGLAGALFGSNQGHDITQESIVAAVGSATVEIRTVAQTPEALRAVVGVLLIAAAQIFTASQFVLEEWILENYAMEPLQVVGWEGIFGFSVTVIASIILYFGVGRTEAGRYGYFDAKEGWHQVLTHRAVAVSSVMIMISIGYAMFFSTYDIEANFNSAVVSTFSGSRLREPSPRQVDRRLIPAAPCSSGLSPLA
jgi:drug/metabolite transporter (DMT)-like permease